MSIDRISFKGNEITSLIKVIENNGTNLSEEAKLFLMKKELQRELIEAMPKPIGFINRLNKKISGEIPNIMINAAGTGLVAPFFIRYNFLSKTDKDTRTYSAWRQPISALLAIITQATVVNRVDKSIMKKSNLGLFENQDFNMNFLQDEDYLAQVIKKEMPGIKGEELDLEIFKRQALQLDEAVKSLRETGTIMLSKEGKMVPMDKKQFRDLLVDTIEGAKKSIDDDIKRYSGVKEKLQAERGECYRLYKEDVTELLDKIKGKLATDKDYKSVSKWLKKEIKELKKTDIQAEIINIANDISSRPNIASMNKQLAEIEDRLVIYSKCKTTEEVRKAVKEHLSKKVNDKSMDMKILEEIKTTVCSEKLDKIKMTEIFENAEKQLKSSNLLYETVQKHLNNVKGNIKGHKSGTGLIVSLAILPVTCMLLNWIYPKFMDIAFPNLSKKKQEQGKDKDTFVKSTYLPNPQHSTVNSQEVGK